MNISKMNLLKLHSERDIFNKMKNRLPYCFLAAKKPETVRRLLSLVCVSNNMGHLEF